MKNSKRATIYLDPEIRRALRLKALSTERSLSALVNDALRLSLAEDAEDQSAFEERAEEEVLDFEQVVRGLRRSGRI